MIPLLLILVFFCVPSFYRHWRYQQGLLSSFLGQIAAALSVLVLVIIGTAFQVSIQQFTFRLSLTGLAILVGHILSSLSDNLIWWVWVQYFLFCAFIVIPIGFGRSAAIRIIFVALTFTLVVSLIDLVGCYYSTAQTMPLSGYIYNGVGSLFCAPIAVFIADTVRTGYIVKIVKRGHRRAVRLGFSASVACLLVYFIFIQRQPTPVRVHLEHFDTLTVGRLEGIGPLIVNERKIRSFFGWAGDDRYLNFKVDPFAEAMLSPVSVSSSIKGVLSTYLHPTLTFEEEAKPWMAAKLRSATAVTLFRRETITTAYPLRAVVETTDGFDKINFSRRDSIYLTVSERPLGNLESPTGDEINCSVYDTGGLSVDTISTKTYIVVSSFGSTYVGGTEKSAFTAFMDYLLGHPPLSFLFQPPSERIDRILSGHGPSTIKLYSVGIDRDASLSIGPFAEIEWQEICHESQFVVPPAWLIKSLTGNGEIRVGSNTVIPFEAEDNIALIADGYPFSINRDKDNSFTVTGYAREVQLDGEDLTKTVWDGVSDAVKDGFIYGSMALAATVAVWMKDKIVAETRKTRSAIRRLRARLILWGRCGQFGASQRDLDS